MTSEKLSKRPFDFTLTREDATHFTSIQIPVFRCPAYSGDNTVQPSLGSEYDDLSFIGGGIAISNYMAIVGTHASDDGTINENGVIVSGCENGDEGCEHRGLRVQDVADGISNTAIICETREPVYAAWMDGQATWVVGLDPRNAGVLGDDGFATAEATMIDRPAYSAVALPGSWPGRVGRDWGPSSEHKYGAYHGFADAHAMLISADIDATVYYRLITRAGAEPVDSDEL